MTPKRKCVLCGKPTKRGDPYCPVHRQEMRDEYAREARRDESMRGVWEAIERSDSE